MKKITKKYKIIFDTNILWQDKEDKVSKLFNLSLEESFKFIKEHSLNSKIILSIPEIVVAERIEQTLSDVNNMVNTIANKVQALSPFGVKISENCYKLNYEKEIIKIKKAILNKSQVEVIKSAKVRQSEIIRRSLKGIKPFSAKGDKGFRDTIIWLSILDDAKINNDCNYILCSNNSSDFNETSLSEEFMLVNKNSFKVVSDMPSLKQLLDVEFDLNLELKKLFQEIKNELNKKIGDIMVSVNNYEVRRKSALENALDVTTMYESIRLDNSEEFIAGYNFKSISYDNIFETKYGAFNIRATVTTIPRMKNSTYRHIPSYINLYETEKTDIFSVILDYSIKSNLITAINVTKVSPHRYSHSL
ncbi:MAG: hypothetical protein UT48_C0018G0031 [Parcubacteria group bacterium GW2011_GWE2_39_37]|uniref:DUF4935 domain-containing protein n=1 Tax=Candidatus Falkowbacteria bacterium GW2011_GWF2_39_8 TaxID=1618642 RepID=A0A0G0Q0T7_9BACT|nr:MAG: hypothetical protein UT48_C0018G0031 [Parcubacteria group bacterium GW2011_GWE2_39_37]KKR30976.1 MAG: hypothetical protein UT64_C0078G0006 [Candidatus Falkowbacteria bacterium GW2011_GWF2_39_8]